MTDGKKWTLTKWFIQVTAFGVGLAYGLGYFSYSFFGVETVELLVILVAIQQVFVVDCLCRKDGP